MSEKVTHEELVERARALLPTLKERAKQTDELRRIPDETIRDLREAGLFRAVQPVQYGGYGLPPTPRGSSAS